jgi:NAD(P)-dependent dehydrogenase (short-subunit alcohol dehydrogenase family)
MTTDKTLTGQHVLITGANRGLGRALVDEALQRGARRVYAGTRRPLTDTDGRIVPVLLDITDATQIRAASDAIDTLDVLVNNAGIARYDDLTDHAVLEQHLAVNLFGPHAMVSAFSPQLVRSRGTVVNVLSLASLASLPMIPSYSVSKAAAFSLTQTVRAMLAAQDVRVHAVLAGPIDTEMSRALDIPKADPADVARAIFDGVASGAPEIFPDPLSATLAPGWREGPVKALELENAALLRAAS